MHACIATGGIAVATAAIRHRFQPSPRLRLVRCRAFASNTKQSVKTVIPRTRSPGSPTPHTIGRHTHTHRRYGRLMFHNSVTRCVCVRAGACNRIPTCASPCVAVRTPSSSARASALNTPPWRRHSRVHAAVPAASLRGFALRACAASSSARAITSSATIRPDLVAPSIESM